MNVEELFEVADWITSWVEGPLTEQYSALQNKILNSVRQPNQREGFEDEKLALYSTLEDIPLEELSRAKTEVLNKLGIADLLGEGGKQKVDEILTSNVLDPNTASKHLEENLSSLNHAIEWASKTLDVLGEIVGESIDDLSGNAAMLHIHFEGEAALNHFQDMKEWSDSWYLIARGMAMASGEAPESIRIVSAGKGSIIIDVIATLTIAKLFNSVIHSVLSTQEKFYQVVIAREYAKRAVWDNEKIQEEFQKEIEQAEEKAIKSVEEHAVSEAGLNKKTQPDEVQNLERAARKLFGFFRKGGDVDIAVTNESDEDPEDGENYAESRAALKEKTAEVKKLSEKVRLLSHEIPYESSDEGSSDDDD